MVAPMAILQNEIPTAGTSDKILAKIGDVLIAKVAITKSKTILYWEVNYKLKLTR